MGLGETDELATRAWSDEAEFLNLELAGSGWNWNIVHVEVYHVTYLPVFNLCRKLKVHNTLQGS